MAKRQRRSRGRSRVLRKNKFFTGLIIALLVLALIAGAYYYFFIYRKKNQSLEENNGSDSNGDNGGEVLEGEGDLSIHFLELGNKYNGDCIFIKTGDTEVLIDGGSREDSSDDIERYIDGYCTDGVLEYVIVTHADQDHIAAFAGNRSNSSLFERFECKTIIDFPRTNKTTQTYQRYLEARNGEVNEGAVRYSALQCYREEDGAKRSYALSENASLNILYNYYYENYSSDENNYSVCVTVTHGKSTYLFTGDLEEEGEEKLLEYNDLPQCKLYKAGHHGSSTSSTEKLLKAIKPEYVCVCCCAGAPEYTKTNASTFPTQKMLDRVLRYTKNVYVTSMATEVDLEKKDWEVTSMNGNIVVRSDGEHLTVTGSNNSTPLPETDWFLNHRNLG